ncbi:MAG: DUF4332 domain-containing protein [Candidatus Limnocylindrales bacterium]
MPPIDELTRIEPVYLGRLEKQGVFTTGILLEVSETPTRRQTLADHVGASILEVLTWRDEALMLNLAAFGPGEHILLAQAGFPGLESILDVDLETFIRRVDRAAADMKATPPAELTMTGWWEQARTLETPAEHVAGPEVDVAGSVLRCLIGAAIGAGGAAVAALAVPSGPPGAQVLVVVLILGITGFVGRLAARGAAGFVGLVTTGVILLGLLLGTTVLIPLPDTFLWQDVGLTFPLGLGVGLPALLVGWFVGWLVSRRMRSTAVRAAQSPAS